LCFVVVKLRVVIKKGEPPVFLFLVSYFRDLK
jgi:hypothetical protein